MEFSEFLSARRKKKNKKSPPQSLNIDKPVEIVEEKELISPVELGAAMKTESYIEKEVKEKVEKNNKRYIGEVAELPATVEYEEGTLVRKGKTVFIKQDGIWESLIEGNTVTREVVKFGVPGGGCGVDEVKRIIKQEGVQEFGSYAELAATTVPVATISGYSGSMLYYNVATGKYDGYAGILAGYPTAVALAYTLGSKLGVIEALVPRLVGGGYFRVRSKGSRFEVLPGEFVAMMADPFAVSSASGTTPVDFLLATLPAGILGNSEEWFTNSMCETGTIAAGSDSLAVLFGGVSLTGAIPISSTSSNPLSIRARMPASGSSGTLRRTFMLNPSSARISGTIDLTVENAVTLRYTASDAGNSMDCRMMSIGRFA